VALDFPASPTNGQTFSGPNGVVWSWDGTKWINAVAASVAYAPIDSPVFTGTPSMPAGAVGVTQTAGDNDNSLATTAFVTNAVGAVPGGATIAPTPPALNPGALWWDSTGGQLYVRFNDGNSTQWTAATNIAGLANAATLTDVGSALNNVGRNLIHNSLMNIVQRGTGTFATTATYSLDRWRMDFSLDAFAISQTQYNDAQRAIIGDEDANNCMLCSVTGNAGAAAFSLLSQPIENVRRLAGKTVIISFTAHATVAALKVGIELRQSFGSGGSPSAVVGTTVAPITLTTSPARYSTTVTLPSISGKTLGTNNDSFTRLGLFLSAGANTNAQAGGIGVQSGTFVFWGVQLEIAQPGQTQPTPLEKRDPVLELQQCQRFYQTGYAQIAGYISAGAGANVNIPFPVPMRATPIITPTWSVQTNCGSSTIYNIGAAYFQTYTIGVASGAFTLSGSFTASADL